MTEVVDGAEGAHTVATGYRILNPDHGFAEMFWLMANEVTILNMSKGWHEKDRSFGDEVALLHSEVSEALEAFREGEMETKLRASDHKPEGMPSELADILIRLLDTCNRYEVSLFAEYEKKMDFNWTRPVRHGGKQL